MSQVVKPPKPPKEKRWLTINFDAKDALAIGDALSELLSLACRTIPQGADVTDEMVEAGTAAILGNKVTFQSGYGIDGQDYEYEAIAKGTLGTPPEELSEYLILEVRGRNVEATS
jgi:hypothetical protein